MVAFVAAAANRIKINHETMPPLKWPPLRRGFQARDPALLQGISKGDKVEFEIVRMGDQYRVTRIEKTN